MRRRQRGVALLHALVIIALTLLFTLTITDLAIFHYQNVQRSEEQFNAREAAQSGLADASRQLSNNPTYGTANEVLTGSVGSANYTVNFKVGTTPYSTNNMGGFVSVPGYRGRSVPAHSALILASGTSRLGEHRTIEAVIHLSALPFPLQSSANVTGNNVNVSAAASLSDYKTSGGGKLPGSVYSGSSSNSAVSMSGATTITGDVVTVGLASLGPTVTVAGKVLGASSPLQVPNLDIASFDNSSTPGHTVVAGGTYNALLNPLGGVLGVNKLSGDVYIDSSVTLIGPVTLDKASVFVAGGGDFVVNGPILGQGSLFVTGKTQMLAGTVIDNDEQIAVFSQKDLSITTGVFQGVLYCHGNITTGPGTIVLGAVIGEGPTENDGSVNIGLGGTIVSIPQYTAFASYFLGRGGGAPVKLDYWAELP